MKIDIRSTKSLIEKLGIKDNQLIVLLNAAESYRDRLESLPSNVKIFKELVKDADFIQFFTTSKIELKTNFGKLKRHLKNNGQLWISWPNISSGIDRDLNENDIIKIGFENGLVDVKVISVNENWSGLKFVYRLKDRQIR